MTKYDDMALINNLYQFRGYGSRRFLAEFLEINWNKRWFNSLLKRSGKQKAPTEGTGAADRSTRILKRTSPLTAVDKLVLSQEDQPQTHHSTRQISRDRSNTFSVIGIIHRDLGLNYWGVRKVAVRKNWVQLLLVFLTLMFHKVV